MSEGCSHYTIRPREKEKDTKDMGELRPLGLYCSLLMARTEAVRHCNQCEYIQGLDEGLEWGSTGVLSL